MLLVDIQDGEANRSRLMPILTDSKNGKSNLLIRREGVKVGLSNLRRGRVEGVQVSTADFSGEPRTGVCPPVGLSLEGHRSYRGAGPLGCS